MVMAGLLWYDDDARRPLAAKIIEATERYRDRLGFAPTVCQLPPQQLKALTEASASHRRRTRTPVIELPRKLRLEPDERLHPNTFLLGMGEEDIVIPNPLLAKDDETPRRSRGIRQPRPAKATPKAAAPASPPPNPAMTATTTPKATLSVKARVAKDTDATVPKPKVARVAKTAAAEKSAEPAISALSVKSTVKRSATPTQTQRSRGQAGDTMGHRACHGKARQSVGKASYTYRRESREGRADRKASSGHGRKISQNYQNDQRYPNCRTNQVNRYQNSADRDKVGNENNQTGKITRRQVCQVCQGR